MFFQSFTAGYDVNGNRQVIVITYNNSGKVDKAYLTTAEQIVYHLEDQGMKQLESLNSKNRFNISQEDFDEMISRYSNQGILETVL